MLFVMVLSAACTAVVKDDEQSSNGRYMAENSLMKKRLPLVERENDVLKKENLQHRAKIQELENQVGQQAMELASLNEKYANDMADGELRINVLQEDIQLIEKEAGEKIEALMSQNRAREKKLSREIQSLNAQIVAQKDTFKQERERIIQENTKRESDLADRLNNLKKTIELKELKISSLDAAISEISIRLGEAYALVETLKKARDKTISELESVKAANADLVNKMNALSHELSVRDKRPEMNN